MSEPHSLFNQPIFLTFTLYCTATRIGEIVKVTGNAPQLGDWNPFNALTLHTTPDTFPVWSAGIIMSKSQFDNLQLLEYKYIITSKDVPNSEVIWESFPGNRQAQLNQLQNLVVTGVWNDNNLIQL